MRTEENKVVTIKFDVTENTEVLNTSVTSIKPLDNLFIPHHVLSVWQEPGTTVRYITVAIILSPGVEKGDFSVKIIEKGKVLELKVDWPDHLIGIRFMHRKWINDRKSNFTDFSQKK